MRAFAVSRFLCLSALVLVLAGCDAQDAAPEDNEPLSMKVAKGDLAAVRKAISNGFDINTPDEDGRTLAHYAVASGQSAMLESLIVMYRADPTIKDKEGRSAVDMARELQDPQLLAILQAEGFL